MKQSGFTLIELLIIISIMSILASIMFGSQYSIREQVYLFQDQYKITDLINKAKNLTLAAYMRDASVCGYGVSFENNNGISEVVLFKDKRSDAKDDKGNIIESCANGHSHEYNNNIDEKIEASSFKLNPMNGFSDPVAGQKMGVTFNAPSLTTFLTKGGENVPETTGNILISFSSIKSNIPVNISINRFGQTIAESGVKNKPDSGVNASNQN